MQGLFLAPGSMVGMPGQVAILLMPLDEALRQGQLSLVAPELPMDNNLTERLLRTPGMGRKNVHGHRAAWSGKRSALVRSILTTGEPHRLDPLRYLTEHLTACAGLAAASLWRGPNRTASYPGA
ncbi:MAG: hypothetical protein M0Z27_00745 [Thermaerobacter sp.]|nr:hypothetical protein [Thermaerobacter sp.]